MWFSFPKPMDFAILKRIFIAQWNCTWIIYYSLFEKCTYWYKLFGIERTSFICTWVDVAHLHILVVQYSSCSTVLMKLPKLTRSLPLSSLNSIRYSAGRRGVCLLDELCFNWKKTLIEIKKNNSNIIIIVDLLKPLNFPWISGIFFRYEPTE